MSEANRRRRTITLYRDDSTTPVVIENVKHYWYEAGNTVLVVSYVIDEMTGSHDYVHWPVRSFKWFRDEKTGGGRYKPLTITAAALFALDDEKFAHHLLEAGIDRDRTRAILNARKHGQRHLDARKRGKRLTR